MVRRWITLSMPSVPATASRIARFAAGVADSPSTRLLVSIARMIAITTSSSPISAVPATSKYWLPVSSINVTPRKARLSPTSAPRSSRRITGSSGDYARRTNVT